MFTIQDCIPIIKRLGGQAGWKDTDKEIKQILAEALRDAASNPYHAEKIVKHWVDNNKFLPTPHDFLMIAQEVPASKPVVHNTGSCSLCRGTGTESYWALVTISRWEDSGRIKNRDTARLPVDRWVMAEAEQNQVDPQKLSIMRSPRIEGGEQDGLYWEAVVDGINQRVAVVNAYCVCDYGRHLREERIAGIERDSQKRNGA